MLYLEIIYYVWKFLILIPNLVNIKYTPWKQKLFEVLKDCRGILRPKSLNTTYLE